MYDIAIESGVASVWTIILSAVAVFVSGVSLLFTMYRNKKDDKLRERELIRGSFNKVKEYYKEIRKTLATQLMITGISEKDENEYYPKSPGLAEKLEMQIKDKKYSIPYDHKSIINSKIKPVEQFINLLIKRSREVKEPSFDERNIETINKCLCYYDDLIDEAERELFE